MIKGDEYKLADFGSTKEITRNVSHTDYISTRWYRPPECLMTDGWYDYKVKKMLKKMDIWGLGCVFYELLMLKPLFPGKNELDQIKKIHRVLGTPSANILDKFKRYSLK